MVLADRPFASNAHWAFLGVLPVSPANHARITHRNADGLLRLPRLQGRQTRPCGRWRSSGQFMTGVKVMVAAI
jgi:hypothetical protein